MIALSLDVLGELNLPSMYKHCLVVPTQMAQVKMAPERASEIWWEFNQLCMEDVPPDPGQNFWLKLETHQAGALAESKERWEQTVVVRSAHVLLLHWCKLFKMFCPTPTLTHLAIFVATFAWCCYQNGNISQ